MTDNGTISFTEETSPTDYPFELIAVNDGSGITAPEGPSASTTVFDLLGRRIGHRQPAQGIYIVNGKKIVR